MHIRYKSKITRTEINLGMEEESEQDSVYLAKYIYYKI